MHSPTPDSEWPQFLQMRYTIGRASAEDPYHVEIIKDKLMRALPTVTPETIDELAVAIPELIPTAGEGACRAALLVVCRTADRDVSRRVDDGAGGPDDADDRRTRD